MTEPFRIAVAGLGTVGAGVIAILDRHRTAMEARIARPIAVTAVSARNRGLERGVDLSGIDWEDDATRLAHRADVDCVVEVIGGSNGPAKALVEQALAAGKHVVTANKALIAHHGHELATAAESANVLLAGEAGVAGGIPVLRSIGEGLAANTIERVLGVLNGTCNYILTEMARTGQPYEAVLAEAQRLGYAEADPYFDVGGVDAAHKLAILAALAFGTRIDFDGVVTEGIERITLADIETARDMGFAIKLLALARMHPTGLEQRVRPCMVPADSPIGGLAGVTNAVAVEGDAVGQCAFTGPGAGAGPTASAILADVLDAGRGATRPLFGRPAAALAEAARLSHGEEHSPYYMRFSLEDRPGALAALAGALGESGISIHRMRQYGRGEGVAPVVIVTHDTRRDAIDAALARIETLPESRTPPVAIRIEEA